VIQGWIVTDAAVLARLTIPDDEAVVEVPDALLDHLALDGLDGEVTNAVPPIVRVTPSGNYIIQRVMGTEALSQMSIPDHDTCVPSRTTSTRRPETSRGVHHTSQASSRGARCPPPRDSH
jgi:hypothetical protein